MTSPIKPWEKPLNSAQSGASSNFIPTTTSAPPLPPRPTQQYMNNSNMSNYNRFTSPYSYSSPFSSCYSPYYGGFNQNFGYFGSGFGGAYGGYGNGHSSFDGSGISLFRLAEESSRQAFHSIEQIVQAFSSISMLLESTYFALRNSFQAIVGVAENFSSLRVQLASVISTLALFRMLRRFLNYILRLIGYKSLSSSLTGDDDESIWTRTESNSANQLNEELLSPNQASMSPTWPLLLFFGFVCGTPWIVWKLFQQSNESKNVNSDKWKTGEASHYAAIATYDFQAESEQEISFKSGQLIRVAPKHLQPNTQGWLLAHANNKTGLVPANRIKILKFFDETSVEQTSSNPSSNEPLTE